MECTSIYQHVIISMDAVFHGLLYGESNACPDAHVVIATNAMFVVGGDVQHVQVPTKLSEEAKDALRAFDAACQGKPAPEKEKKKRFMDKLKETFED